MTVPFHWGFLVLFPKLLGYISMAKTPEWASKHNLEICGQYIGSSHVHCDNVWCKEVQGQCKQHQYYIWYRKGEMKVLTNHPTR